jgi:serine/threonine protein kinase
MTVTHFETARHDVDSAALNEYYTTQLKGETFRIPKRYVIDRLIGKGSYGVVAAGRDVVTGESVAIKKNKGIFPSSSPVKDHHQHAPHCRSIMSQKRILRELKILLHINHPSIISIKDVFQPEEYDTFTDLYFVTVS